MAAFLKSRYDVINLPTIVRLRRYVDVVRDKTLGAWTR